MEIFRLNVICDEYGEILYISQPGLIGRREVFTEEEELDDEKEEEEEEIERDVPLSSDDK